MARRTRAAQVDDCGKACLQRDFCMVGTGQRQVRIGFSDSPKMLPWLRLHGYVDV